MNVLVDFDNVPREIQRKGIQYLVDRILRHFDGAALERQRNVTIRLYGGWYERNFPTKQAQRLSIELQALFPSRFRFLRNGQVKTVPVDVELAYALLAHPRQHLFSTYRMRNIQKSVACFPPSSIGCADSTCPLNDIYSFFSAGICPSSQCTIEISQCFHKNEQKLVDSMMVSDMLFVSVTQADPISIVSADDDLWPGILTALAHGADIVHFYPKHYNRRNKIYTAPPGSQYEAKRL